MSQKTHKDRVSLILDEKILEKIRIMMNIKFTDMVQFYQEDVTGYIQAIRHGLDQNDIEKISEAAHTIKSSSTQIGAVLLSEIADEMESMAQSIVNGEGGDLETMAVRYENLIASFADTKTRLDCYLDSVA